MERSHAVIPSIMKTKSEGIWIGIDLGTSNCTAAFWDTVRNRAKLIRFRSDVASRISGKCGRVLPSCVSYEKGEGNVTAVGQGATEKAEGKDEVLFSSVKRIWGITSDQILSELRVDKRFLESCPFDATLTFSDEEAKKSVDGARLCIEKEYDRAGNQKKQILIPPLQVATQLLETIRKESELYFRRERDVYPIQSPCSDPSVALGKVRNVVIGVPAHFSRNRCQTIVDAAISAGFDGQVSTIVESTAAAMAYGINVTAVSKDCDSKNILVFDMGGGTTDVTIAQMTKPKNTRDEPAFRVLATSGDRSLGGDEMDILLAQFLSNKLLDQDDEDWTKLRRFCRTAKEELCGNGKSDCPQQNSIALTYHKKTFDLRYDQFDTLIQPLIDRASSLVKSTLSKCNIDTKNDSHSIIDEVILVGGASQTPSIASMLHILFPNVELCTLIQGEKAVAQGAAIQAALRSGLVPRHIVRNAMMLDVLPHSIGVLIPTTEEEEEMYVPILEQGMTLPAMNYAKFLLAKLDQRGVTVVVVEDVGNDFALERLGEFTFLLHRLSDVELSCIDKEGDDIGRSLDVGLTVEHSGRLIVRIFDKNDPEHLKKKELYKKWKQQQVEGEGDRRIMSPIYPLGQDRIDQSFQNKISGLSWEEIILMLLCVVVFGLYVLIKSFFHKLEE